jgi:acyl carrier protein
MFVELIEMTAGKYNLDIKLQSIGKYMLKAPMDTMSSVVDMFCKIYQYGNDIVNQ